MSRKPAVAAATAAATKPASTDDVAHSPGRFARLSIDRIRPSRTNPRTRFTDMEELIADVKMRGIIQPLVVRAVPVQEDGRDHELVAGERRLRAAIGAGLTEVPAMVHEYSELAALEVQLVENGQRKDPHPLEEAIGYRHYLDERKRELGEEADAAGIEFIAARISKSVSHVRGRLKLLGLGPDARTAFLGGELDASRAELVARIPDFGLQNKAIREITNERGGQGPLSFREARRHLASNYTVRLQTAQWDLGDAELVPAAGPCSSCPKRGSEQSELFAAVQDAERVPASAAPDVCTDAGCFKQKQEAFWDRARAEAERAHKKIVPESEAKKLFPNSGDHLAYNAPVVKLTDHCPDDPKRRTFAELLKKAGAGAEVQVVRAPSGAVHEVANKRSVEAALADAGFEFAAKKGHPISDAEKKEREKQKQKRALLERVIGAVADKAADVHLTERHWFFLAKALLERANVDPIREICKRREIAAVVKKHPYATQAQRDWKAALEKWFDKASEAEAIGFVFELAVSDGAYFQFNSQLFTPTLKEATTLFKVDVEALEGEIKTEAKGKAKGKAAPKKGGEDRPSKASPKKPAAAPAAKGKAAAKAAPKKATAPLRAEREGDDGDDEGEPEDDRQGGLFSRAPARVAPARGPIMAAAGALRCPVTRMSQGRSYQCEVTLDAVGEHEGEHVHGDLRWGGDGCLECGANPGEKHDETCDDFPRVVGAHGSVAGAAVPGLAVGCPTCKVKAGVSCLEKPNAKGTGGEAIALHAARLEAARKASAANPVAELDFPPAKGWGVESFDNGRSAVPVDGTYGYDETGARALVAKWQKREHLARIDLKAPDGSVTRWTRTKKPKGGWGEWILSKRAGGAPPTQSATEDWTVKVFGKGRLEPLEQVKADSESDGLQRIEFARLRREVVKVELHGPAGLVVSHARKNATAPWAVRYPTKDAAP